MSTFHQTTPRPHVFANTSPSPRPATRPAAADQDVASFAALFCEHTTDYALMQPWGINRKTQTAYKKYVRTVGAITPALISDHLRGRATLATQPQRGGLASWIVFDLDQGQQLQSAVDRLRALGVWSFAVASYSADQVGNPAHQGGHIWIPVDAPHQVDQLAAVGRVLVEWAELGPVEQWPRPGKPADIRLPFGRNQRAQSGREWGTLHTPGAAPLDLASGPQGLAALLPVYHVNPLAALLAIVPATPAAAPAPQARQAAPFAPKSTKAAPGDRLDSAQLIQAFNAAVDVRTVLESFSCKPSGPRRYRCSCGHHTSGQEDALKIVALQKPGFGVQTFGANCILYGRTHDAFGVLQTLGGYAMREALDEARRWLNLPAFEPQRPAPSTPARPVNPAPVVVHPAMVLQAARNKAALDTELSKSTRRVLGVLLDQGAAKGWCQLSNKAIHLAADCCEATARTSLYTLRDRGYITIDCTGNAYGGAESNYYIFCNPLTAKENSPLLSAKAGGGLISGSPNNVLSTQYGGGNSGPAILTPADDTPAAPESDALLTSSGPLGADEWDSLLALAPAPDQLAQAGPVADDYPPRTVAPGAAAAAPRPLDQHDTTTTTRPAGAHSPASTVRPAIEATSNPPRYAAKFGPNAAARAILAAIPGYVPDEPDMVAPAPQLDPPPALLDQAAALIADGAFSDYETFKAAHPGYDWSSSTDQRASYRRWLGIDTRRASAPARPAAATVAPALDLAGVML